MSVIISPSYVITESTSGGGVINADNPLIGYRTLAVPGSISTDTAAAGFPADNMSNPATHLRWVGEISEADEHVMIDTGGEADVDYVAIARHNLGSAGIAVAVDYLDVNAEPIAWVELIAPVLLPNDGPALFRFPKLAYAQVRLRLSPGGAAPTIAVVYAGELLVLQRRLYVNHAPMPYQKKTKVTNARSEAGHFLGRIVLGQMTGTSVTLANLTPGWFRTYMAPFLEAGQETPFFFAWRPGAYPREIGYGWLTNDPAPQNERSNGMMGLELQIAGVV